ncbi:MULTISPECIES: MFS transporter [Amycolatopsis]|uniref:MFS transporter n=1 Tax=Amycolatopsis dendrobii TaxID=2760662 RepID=A0A7W3W5P2_9PSEU|nr:MULTISPECIES: MFS transporter [Amycolatopsis]MBB1159199.1 MFS transporter [Amycolatopsis dendrobii]UKD58302.1 MFS transporter [Amycolatopsis sp. FU40]
MSRPVWLLLIGTLINRLGSFLQVYLVLYLTDRGFSTASTGFALGAFGVGTVVGVIIGGSVSDRLGYRHTIVGSMLVAGVLTVALPHLTNIAAVVGVVGAVGLTSQAYRPAASALLIDLTPPERHIMVFAAYRLAYNVGTVAGPLLGALLITYSYEAMFYCNAIALVAFGLLAFSLPKHSDVAHAAPSGDPEAAAEQSPDRPGRPPSYLAVLSDTRFIVFNIAMILGGMVYIQSISTLALHVTASGHSPGFYAALLSINAFVITCLELPITRFVQRMTDRATVAVGNILVGAGMMLYLAGPSAAVLVIATLVWTAGEMVGTPTITAYPGRIAPPRLRGRYIALSEFATQVGYAAGPALGVALWAVWPAGVWWLCGVLTVVAVFGSTVSMPGAAERNRQPLDS